MKKELFLRIIISVLILINLATVLSYINIRGELKLSQTKKLDCQSYKEALSSNLSNVQMNSNIKIDQNISITDSYESKIILKNLFKSGPKLIVYNSETGCSLCIEKELEIIKNISTKIGVKNIIIISNFNIKTEYKDGFLQFYHQMVRYYFRFSRKLVILKEQMLT